MSQERRQEPPVEHFDENVAARLIGRTLLVGVTHRDHNGVVVGRSQVFGRVVRAERGAGIFVRSDDGEYEACLPPDTRGILPGRLGTYRNRATGEVVENPDFTAAWTFTSAAPVQ